MPICPSRVHSSSAHTIREALVENVSDVFTGSRITYHEALTAKTAGPVKGLRERPESTPARNRSRILLLCRGLRVFSPVLKLYTLRRCGHVDEMRNLVLI